MLRQFIGVASGVVGDWSSGFENWAEEATVKKIQVQGVHHTTIVGSTKQSAIDFWSGVLGMPFVLE